MADLAQRVDAELENLGNALKRLPTAQEIPALSELELAGTAALVSSFYNGLENIVKQILRDRGLALPTGESWHKELIEMAFRERIISEKTRNGIREYSAFRHFFAHAYAFDIDPSQIGPLVTRLESVHEGFRKDCAAAVADKRMPPP